MNDILSSISIFTNFVCNKYLKIRSNDKITRTLYKFFRS